MPNNGHYTLCPYFVAEKNKNIHCEDIIRRFGWHKTKQDWMHKYCDAEWEQCPYAIELEKIYEKEGDFMAELDKHRLESLEKENRRLATKLARIEKERDQKKEAIRSMKNRYNNLEAHYNELNRTYKLLRIDKDKTISDYKEWNRACLELIDDYTTMVNKVAGYLMYMLAMNKLPEEEVDEWKKDHDYLVETKYDGDKKYWVLVPREEYTKNV